MFLYRRSAFWSLEKGILTLCGVVLVGVLSGVISANNAREETETEWKAKLDKQTADKVSTVAPETEKPATKAPEPTSKPTTKGPATKAPTKAPTQPPTQPPAQCTDEWCNVRLPKHVRPSHYNLDIKADVVNLKFNGKISAYINVTKETSNIILHIKEMNITSANLTTQDDPSKPIEIEKSFPHPENEYHVSKTKAPIKAGTYIYTVTYEALVSEKLTGFYKSTYKENGKTEVLLTTKFQPTDSRKAFPNFDEPDLKATFSISIEHPATHHARCNMPGTTANMVDPAWKKTTFGKTVKMSSYLIAFVVSKFKGSKVGKAHNLDVQVWSRPDQIANTEYAYNATIKMMEFLEDFTNVSYPMPKLDSYGIPDYGSGATEHWGIITYRESRLLYDPKKSSQSNKQSSATIIGHECTHLWFGNLVTCKWWNDLWVQEGMASYLEYYAADAVHPDWKMMDSFITVDWKTGITLDALASSHPISQDVSNPKKIKQAFDSITYNKGSSLFQMLDSYLTTEVFKRGIYIYLRDNQYTGATVDDYWEAFTKATEEHGDRKDIKAIMDTWTHQMGFPVITISRKNGNDSKVVIQQEHFLIDPNSNVTRESKFGYQWQVPFTYVPVKSQDTQLSNVTKSHLLKDKKAELDITGSDYIIGNHQHKGFYRVNYEVADWNKIIDQFNKDHTFFSVTDRAGIIDDAFAFARSGRLNYEIAFNLTSYLEKEESYFVWKMALGNMGYLDTVLSAQNSYSAFRQYMRNLLAPKAKKLGVDVDKTTGHLEKYKQLKFISSAAAYGDEWTIEQLSNMFRDWMVNGTSIPSDLKSNVLWYGVAQGGDEEWDYVYKQMQSSNDPSEKSKLQSALSATEKPWILRKWLTYTLDNSKIRHQDMVYVVGNVARNNPTGKYVAWDFVRANWKALYDIAKENNFHVASMTSAITAQFTTEFELESVEEFWKEEPEAGTGANARVQGIEKMKSHIEWIKKYSKTIEDWLKKQNP